MKILFCFGTRPEAIKMAPLYLELKKRLEFNVLLCVTAQHREMLDQVLDFFEITPDYDLDIMQSNQSLTTLSASILVKMDQILQAENPDIVFVHGDTTTSSMVSLAAFYKKIKVAHIEAGLRTNDKYSPFPEEINRQITARIADLNFAPTQEAKENLLNEGITESKIFVTGNTVIDALFLGIHKIKKGYSSPDLVSIQNIVDDEKKIILITGHRRENFGVGFENLCHAIAQLSLRDDVQIIYPVHLNPNVQEPVNRILSGCKNVHLIAPLDYPAFIFLMQKSYLILTDSGGIQEEAPSLGKPVLVMRDISERPEAIEAGTVKLVGTHKETIINETVLLLDNQDYYLKMSQKHNPYGDGNASSRIIKNISCI